MSLASCGSAPDLNGLWQSTKDSGTIEFKATGEVIIIDNMSATVTGRYELLEGDKLKLQLTATDIMHDSMQAIPEKVINVKIITLNADELHIDYVGELGAEQYKRVR